MTKAGCDFASTMNMDTVPPVSSDVIFLSSQFSNYKAGLDNQIVELDNGRGRSLTMKEVVVRETTLLLEQQKRISVRHLASKFEKGFAVATKLSEEDKVNKAASLEKHVLLKKLRDALESLRGCVAGKNKDVEEAIAMTQDIELSECCLSVQVEALAIQLTQREGELMQEKEEVKKLASFLKQASEDAKKLVDKERSLARSEIENARSAVQRVEEALNEHEQVSRAEGKQDYEELMKEVQEARRIKMLHQPSRVMAMEHEIQALRAQILEKAKHSVRLQKEVAMKSKGQSPTCLYELDGQEILGSFLSIHTSSDEAADLSLCSFQWYRVHPVSGKKEAISGATKSVYAPEPLDAGRVLEATVTIDGNKLLVSTSGPIDPAPGLGSYVEALMGRYDNEFNVIATQINGVDQPSQSIHALHVGKMRMKLCKGKAPITKEYYSSVMQLCGVRGGGNAAAQAAFWQAKQGLSFILAFESERDRNAAIMVARRFAFDCNIMLAGPGDRPVEA